MIGAILAQTGTDPLSEVLRAVREQFQRGGSATLALGLLAGLAAILWVTHVLAKRQRLARATRLPADPARLFRDLMAGLGLTAEQRQALVYLAGRLKLANPAVLLLCPALFDRASAELRPTRPAGSAGGLASPAAMAKLRSTLFPA